MTLKSKFFLLVLISQNLSAQILDSIYVKERESYFKVIAYEFKNDEAFNALILINGCKVPYGKWKFYHENGELKSQGTLSFKFMSICGTQGDMRCSYRAIRDGKWEYWDIKGKVRTNLQYPEKPYEGICQLYLPGGVIMEEGLYKKGVLFTGKRYKYHRLVTEVDEFRDGIYKGKKWK